MAELFDGRGVGHGLSFGRGICLGTVFPGNGNGTPCMVSFPAHCWHFHSSNIDSIGIMQETWPQLETMIGKKSTKHGRRNCPKCADPSSDPFLPSTERNGRMINSDSCWFKFLCFMFVPYLEFSEMQLLCVVKSKIVGLLVMSVRNQLAAKLVSTISTSGCYHKQIKLNNLPHAFVCNEQL